MARPTSCTSGADAEAATTKSARKTVAKSLLNIVSVGGKNVGWEESAEDFFNGGRIRIGMATAEIDRLETAGSARGYHSVPFSVGVDSDAFETAHSRY
jgi:hypothetical protein